MFRAGDFCNRQVVTATADEPVTEVARRMRDAHVGAVVVVEEQDRGLVPVGMLSDRDLVVGLIAVEPTYLTQAVVRDLMSGRLVTATEGADLYEVMERMRCHGIRRLPIVDAEGVLQGLIAFDDLVAEIAEELRNLSSLLQCEQENERHARPRGLQSRGPLLNESHHA